MFYNRNDVLVNRDLKIMLEFRATFDSWIRAIGVTLAVALFFVTGGFVAAAPLSYLFAVPGALVTLEAIREYVLPVWRAHLSIDAEGVRARVDGELSFTGFEQIEVVRLLQDSQGQYYLWLCQAEDILSVPLKYLDVDRIWPAVQRHFEPEQVGEKAYTKWIVEQEFFRELVRENVELVHGLTAPLRPRQHRWWTAVGWSTFVFGILLSILASLNEEALWIPLLFFVFSMLGLTLIFPGTVEMDAQQITYHSPALGRFQIHWSEVQRIEYSPDHQRLIFYADDTRWLSIRGPLFWRPKERAEAQALIRAQAQVRAITMHANRWAAWKMFSRNTRTT
jgi:hypothetical protein